jgi:excisionase family DNA binding protein
MTEINLLSEEEAAQLLRVAGRTLRRYRTEGRVGYLRIGREPMYLRSDLEEFLKQCRVPPQPLATGGSRSPSNDLGPGRGLRIKGATTSNPTSIRSFFLAEEQVK